MAASDEIKARLDIVDLAARYAPDLRKSGKNFIARCPFHQERTPSFVVFPDRQTWRCFGACAVGGDLFGLVMRAEKLDFVDALKLLAREAGITLTQRQPSKAAPHPLLRVNERAIRFFQDALAADRGSFARSYLDQRMVGAEAVLRFGLGYSPSTGDELLRHMHELGVPPQQAVAAGLAVQGEDGAYRDMFRGRLMFAIRNAEGEVVGFGGRALDDAQPKYLNTPQTELFDKGGLLYGLDHARETMARDGLAVVVEGYMDVIAAHEHGYRNVVASMGTAMTEHQVALLRHHARSFVLALDPDTAGQEATLRSLEGSWRVFGRSEARGPSRQAPGLYQTGPDLQVLRIAVLPEDKDPDQLIRQDPMEWRRLVAEAVPVVDYLFDVLPRRLSLTDSEQKAQMADRLFPLIAAMQNPYDQDRYFQRLAELLGVARATLEASVGRPQRRGTLQRQRPARTLRAAVTPFRQAEGDTLDEYALALLVQYPPLQERAAELTEEYLRQPESRELLRAIRDSGTIGIDNVKSNDLLAVYLARLMEKELPPADRKQQGLDFDACLRRLEERHLRGMKAQEEALWAQGDQPVPVPEGQITAINERLRDVFTRAGGTFVTVKEHGKEDRKG